MPGAARRRVEAGEGIAGLAVVPPRLAIGDVIDELAILAADGLPEDFRDQVLVLPVF